MSRLYPIAKKLEHKLKKILGNGEKTLICWKKGQFKANLQLNCFLGGGMPTKNECLIQGDLKGPLVHNITFHIWEETHFSECYIFLPSAFTQIRHPMLKIWKYSWIVGQWDTFTLCIPCNIAHYAQFSPSCVAKGFYLPLNCKWRWSP